MHHQKIMRNEEICNPKLLLQILEHVDDLSLYGHIQCRDRFIAHYELGVHSQCTRNSYALPLASRELMGIAARMLRIESYVLHELEDLLTTLALGRIQPMHIQRLTNDVLHRHTRVQGGIRVLEDHLHVAPHLGKVLLRDKLAIEKDLSGSRLVQMKQRTSNSGLSAA